MATNLSVRLTDRLATVRAIDDWALQQEAGDAGDRGDLRAAVARDLVQLAALRTAVNALAAAGIAALVMKGAALSFTCYPNHFRPRNDDDLLVAPADFDAASHALARAGYRMTVQIDDVAVVGQRLFCRDVSGVTHHLDLHARPLNPLAFADLPSFAALSARSIALPELGEHARAVGPVDALVLACAHRVAHHTATEDPLWLFDIHLLAGGLRADQWREFITTAQAARVARLSASELQRAASTHHTAIPPDVIDQLALATGEASARHLQTLGPLHTQWLNLRDAAGWRPRIDMLRSHLFPPVGYMRQRYADAPDTPLPALYARRLFDGSTRWLREWLDRYRAA